jgi:hypothetical protein
MTRAEKLFFRRTLICSGWLLACVLVAACRSPPGKEVRHPEVQPSFVAKTWMSTDPSAAPGTLRIFLPDGTLVMDSCGESYRLARWRSLDERHLEWQEDTARIEAEMQVSQDRLHLRLHLAGEIKEEHYQLARAPFVCPDTRR